jgi:dihydroorotate dehydrogenase
MRNIADDIETKQTIENVSDEFLANINEGIEIEKIAYQLQDNNTLRISTTIDVPSATPITEKHKNELSQMLALATEKSVSLDINIVNVSSVLIERKEEITKDKQLQEQIEAYVKENTGMIILESKIAYNPTPLVYLNLI